MSDPVIVALISGVLTLIGTGITVVATNNKTKLAYEKSQAIIEERVSTLTAEVRKHNNFAERIPVLETQMAELNRRVSELEKN